MSDNKIVLLKQYVKAKSPKFATTCKKYQLKFNIKDNINSLNSFME